MKVPRIYGSARIGKYLLPLVLLLVLVFPLAGCASPDTAAEHEGNSFLWRVSSDSGHVYLMGSIHVASPAVYPLAGAIEDAFRESDKLVVEININEVSVLRSMLLLEKYGKYPGGEGLEDNLPEELYEELAGRFLEMGIPLAALNDYRPWVIYAMMEGMVTGEGDYSVEYGIDLHFLDRAAEQGMEILELETAASQMEMLSGISDELMILMLEMSVAATDTADYVDLMFELWEEGDAAGMAELVFEERDREPALAPFYDVILDRRNYDMMARIETYLADGYTYFVVVGAAHLVGDEGLVNRLAEAGYNVEQL